MGVKTSRLTRNSKTTDGHSLDYRTTEFIDERGAATNTTRK